MSTQDKMVQALPEPEQMETWRHAADMLLRMDSRTLHMPTIREAALRLQDAYLAVLEIGEALAAHEAEQEPQPEAAQAEPNDWHLPAALKVGHVTFGKGIHCSALVLLMKMLHEAAFGVDNLSPEQKAENLAALQSGNPLPHDFLRPAVQDSPSLTAEQERDKLDAERWRFAMDWDQKDFAVCRRVGKTGVCWNPIKTDGPIDAARAAMKEQQ